MTVEVALLAEGVDRNTGRSKGISWKELVALLAEGVDRNGCIVLAFDRLPVALLAEGVDRNLRVAEIANAVESRPPRGGRG